MALMKEDIERLTSLPDLRPPPPTVSEDEFRNVWLPVLLDFYQKGEDARVDMWISQVSQTAYNEVHVLDNNDPQKVLFVVPAILNRDIKLFDEDTAKSLSSIFEYAKLNNQNFPGSGNQLIEDKVISKVNIPDNEARKGRQGWIKILNYYGIETDAKHEDTEQSKTSKRIKPNDLVVSDYDDEF